MNLTLETTTGKPVPGGQPVQLARGGTQALTLILLTSNVAGVLADGQPVALKLFDPSDLETPVLSISAWTRDAVNKQYTASLDTMAGALAWVQQKTYLARLDYGDPTVESGFFHLTYGGTSAGVADARPTVRVSTVTTVGKYLFPMDRTGKLSISSGKAIFGYFYAEVDCQIIGAHLVAEDAPTGDDVEVDLINGADEEQSKVMTLTDASKNERTIFGAPLVLSAGDTVRCKLLQVGSTRPGSYLSVNLIVQNT